MATRLHDGSIKLRDGRVIFANSLVQAQDLIEIMDLIVPCYIPAPSWPFISGGGGGSGGSGVIGADGADGVAGTQGNQGFQGPADGAPGSQGPQGNGGVQGFQGVMGAGFQGAQGDQGSVGAQGDDGAQGFQGVAGAGVQGAQGNQGNQGDTGSQGSQGFQGLTGSGTQGTQGSQGQEGSQGFQGVVGVGVQGAQGNQGEEGFQGPQGMQGPQGNQGDTGLQGSQGFQGDAGGGTVQGARVSSTSDILIPNATVTFIPFNREIYDVGGFWVVGSPTRLTIPVSGIYDMFCSATFNTSSGGQGRSVFVRINGVGTAWLIHNGKTGGFSGTQPTYVIASGPWQFTAGDYIEMGVYQDSGGPLNLNQIDDFGISFGITGL